MTELLTALRLGVASALAMTGCLAGTSDGDGCGAGEGLKATPYTGAQMEPKTLAVTLSGGPAEVTARLVEILAAHEVQATFFLEGQQVAADDGVLARLKAQGHLVGNLGYSGASLRTVADPVTEVRKTDELLRPFVSGDVFVFRAPEGDFTAELAERLNEAGLTRYVGPVGADVDAACDVDEVAETCAQRAIEAMRAAGRGIVSLSGTEPVTEDVLRLLLPKLKEEGYQFERLDLVAPLRETLARSGAKPGTVGGPVGCQSYDE